MAYISNKDKKYQEKQKEVNNSTYGFKKDPSKTKTWKFLNLFLIALMVLLPLACVIIVIIQLATK